MNYPKKLMSISELVEMGFSRTDLKQAAHHQLAKNYIMTTANGGKFLFITEEWEKNRKFVLRRQ